MAAGEGSSHDDDDAEFNFKAAAAALLASIPLYGVWTAVGPTEGVLDFIGNVMIAAMVIAAYHAVDRRPPRSD